MSATPPTKPTAIDPTAPYPEPTQADHDAMFASVVWFREQRSTGAFDHYGGMYVAILGEKILDADSDKSELIRRVDALGDTIAQNRVVLQYVPTIEDVLKY